MEIIIILKHAIIGFIMAFLGLLSPGFLTSTTLNTAINRGSKEAKKFVLGVIVPIFIQAHLALLGAEYLQQHTEIIQKFSGIAIYIFLLLSFFFFYQYYNRKKAVLHFNKYNISNSFLYGLFISLINPLAIPFYFTYTSILELKGIIELKEPYISVFVISAMLGAYVILSIYAKHASRFLSKIQLIAKNFRLIMSIIMLLLAITSFIAFKKI